MEISIRFKYSNILRISHFSSEHLQTVHIRKKSHTSAKLQDSTSFAAITHYTGIRKTPTVLFWSQHRNSKYYKKFGLPSLLTQHIWLSGQTFEYFIHSILKYSNMSKWQTLSHLSAYSLIAPGMHFPNYYVVKKQKHGHCSTTEIL